MIIKQYLVLVMLIATISSSAQFESDYTPLVCQGEIPKDITLEAREKFISDLTSEIEKDDSRRNISDKSEILLNSTYQLDALLTSGAILYGDPVSKYINEVADKILEGDPELREDLRFYCVRSSVPNAFATAPGMIFVSIGLMSQLENEAQLAFILMHEIAHYKEKHVITGYIESKKIAKKSRSRSSESTVKKLSDYSKSQELEADSIGFELYAATPYSLEACNGVFDVLQFSHLPFDVHDFNFDFLETESLKIPKKYLQEEYNAIDFDEDTDDKLSTHPNIKKRRTQIMGMQGSKTQKEDSGEIFLLTKERFEEIRTLSRFETISLQLINRKYVACLYNAQSLLEKYPKNNFLKRSFNRALYGIAKYKNENYYTLFETNDKYEGPISIPHYLFEELEKDKLNCLALGHLWREFEMDSSSVIEKRMCEDLIFDLIYEHEIKLDDFKPYATRELSSVSDSLSLEKNEEITDLEPSKYDKLKGTNQTDSLKINTEAYVKSFHLGIFKEADKVEALEKMFEDVSERVANLRAFEDRDISKDELKKERKRKKKASRKKILDDDLEMDQLVFVDPVNLEFDRRWNYKIEKSEESTKEFNRYINEVNTLVDLDVVMIDPKSESGFTTEEYNQMALFKSWLDEFDNHEEEFEDTRFVTSQNSSLKELMGELETPYFCYTYRVNYFDKKHQWNVLFTMPTIALTLFPPVWVPFLDLFRTKRNGVFQTYVYNGETGQLELTYTYNTTFKMDSYAVQAMLYEMLNNLNQ